MTKISYDEYRKHMEQLTFRKAKLMKIMTEKKIAHAEYRDAYNKFKTLTKQQDEITAEIIKLLPQE